MLQSWVGTLATAVTDGTQISNSTTQASIIPATAKFTLPAGDANTIGKTYRISATGRVSCVVTTPGTLLFQVLFGANAVANPTPASFALNATAKTNVTWSLDIVMTVRAIGAGTSANLMWVMRFESEAVVAAAANTALPVFLPASAPAVGNGFDSTVANVVDLQAKFSVATSPTNLTLHTYMLESLN